MWEEGRGFLVYGRQAGRHAVPKVWRDEQKE